MPVCTSNFDKTDITKDIIYVNDVLFMESKPKTREKREREIHEGMGIQRFRQSQGIPWDAHYLWSKETDINPRRMRLCGKKVLKRFRAQNAKPMLEETSNYPEWRGYRSQRVTTQRVSETEATSDLRSQYQSVNWIFAIHYAWNSTGHCLRSYPHVTILC